jgi:hypothetical protein
MNKWMEAIKRHLPRRLPKIESPVGDYQVIVHDSEDPGYVNRIMIGTACTGLLRVQWHQARVGQIIPTNWSNVSTLQFMRSYMPLRWEVDVAQNLIVKQMLVHGFEWLLLYEHDVLPPPNAFVILNEYLRSKDVPIVSGLYFTRSRPSEPIIYRGRGVSYYSDYEMGDKVWVDGVPTGFLLIQRAILEAMWKEAEEHVITMPDGTHVVTRKVFETPRKQWFDPETGQVNMSTGTSDLAWCTKVMKGDFFTKSGWTEYADKQYPFLVDTRLACRHIDNASGEIFPA